MDDASIVSKALFLWVEPMMWKGFRRPLKQEDQLPVPERLAPGPLYAKVAELWAEEVRSVLAANALSKKSRREPSMLRVLIRLLGRDVAFALLLQVSAVGMKFGCILLLRRLGALIVMGNEDGVNTEEGIILAVSLALLNALDGLFSSQATWQLSLAIYKMLSCIAQAVLKKGFALHPGVQGNFRRGDLVSLALSDCNRIVDMAGVLMLGASAPFMLAFAMVLLSVLLGPSVLVVLLAAAAVTVVIDQVGKKQGSSFRAKATWQGRRLATMNEMLQSVRFTKFYALEEHYEEQAQQQRQKEISALRWMKASIACSWPLAATVPVLTIAVVLSLQMAIHGRLPSGPDTLALMAAARFMYYPFAFFSGSWGAYNMLMAVTTRLGTLLKQPEVDHRPFLEQHEVKTAKAAPDVALSIRSRDFRWGLEADQMPTLKSITMEVPRGELWAVVGPLGSGKSSLLAAAAGNISCDGAGEGHDEGGVVASGPSRAYVAQEPVVVNDTLRQNVLFGISEAAGEKLEARYAMALEAAALAHDLEILPDGDSTEIGEKGLTLSGGQKARVALARAVLSSKPGGLVLLDDPLAAVDAHVGAHLFEKCIVEALHGTTRLLVTNQLQFLDHPAVARVLVMEDGCIAEEGRFADLLSDPDSRLTRMAASVGGGKGCGGGAGGASPGNEAGELITVKPTEPADLPLAKKGADEKKGQLMKAESRKEGAVTLAAFKFYFKALGGFHVFLVIAFGSWFFNLGELAPDFFLVVWQDDALNQSKEWYLCVWLAIGVCGCLLNLSSRMLWVFSTTHATKNIHTQVLNKVLRCTTSFFDSTPSGRIMNKLGEDQMLVDFTSALHLEVTCIVMWTCLDIISLIVITRPLVAPFILVFVVCFFGVREVHRRTNREAMRLWLISKSPVFSTFEEVLSGSSTIKAFGREEHFQQRFERAVGVNVTWLMTRDVTNLWMEQRLYLLTALLVFTLALQMVLLPGSVSSSFAAVSVIYALQLGFHLKTFVYFLVQVEGSFASVERLLDFVQSAEQEPPRHLPLDQTLEHSKWPSVKADLAFEDVCLRYLPHMPLALDHLSASLRAGEKVGIVGRTGSGKSTIMGALLRLFKLESGRILLGGVDIATCGLALLRKRVTIVPQDPVLFSGELRKNLDPLGVREDREVWEALRRCSLSEMVEAMGGGLGLEVAEGGKNFSVGERQVLCLARALLRGTQVMCLDEATANVDPENDQRIQRVLTTEVVDCLVLTIAHRLHTVLRSDRIMVLDKGRLAQLAPPSELLTSPGIFRDLATQAGIGLSDLAAIRAPAAPDAPDAPPARRTASLDGLAAALGRAGRLCSG